MSSSIYKGCWGIKSVWLLMGFLFLLGGCASTPKQTFNAEVNRDIKTIALYPGKEDEKARLNILYHPGMSFGLIGGLVAAANISGKEDKYNQAIKGLPQDWGKYTRTRLTEELQKAGYKIVLLDSKEKNLDYRFGLNKTLPKTTADAILNYSIQAGQVASSLNSPYIPSAVINARLVNSKNKAILYEEQFVSGHSGYFTEAVHLPSDSKQYKNMEDLTTHAKESVDDIRNAISKVVLKISSDLRRK